MLHVEGRQGMGVLVLVKEGTMVVAVEDVVVVVYAHAASQTGAV